MALKLISNFGDGKSFRARIDKCLLINYQQPRQQQQQQLQISVARFAKQEQQQEQQTSTN